jgi:hypothetical protein
MAGCAVTAVTAGVAAFGASQGLLTALANIGAVGLLLGLVWKSAATLMVRRQVGGDILTMLTRDREFQ